MQNLERTDAGEQLVLLLTDVCSFKELRRLHLPSDSVDCDMQDGMLHVEPYTATRSAFIDGNTHELVFKHSKNGEMEGL